MAHFVVSGIFEISDDFYRFVINPKRHPGNDDDHKTRDIDGNYEERQLPGEGELNSKATVRA